MANYTRILNLLKKDPIADAQTTFNIQQMLNDNWDKIDAFAAGRAQIASGSYVGTGTSGVNNPNVISVDFNPKLVVVVLDSTDTASIVKPVGLYAGDGSYSMRILGGNNQFYYNNAGWDGDTFSWFNGESTNAVYNQLNVSGKKYNWVAVG